MRWVLCALAVLALALTSASAQPAPRRVALIVGNGAYVTPSWRLANPPRDAALLARRLRGLGFDVDLVTDATRSAMEGAFDRFGAKLKAGGQETVGFFYYAGHGAQKDGVNYLVPVDATASTSDRLRYQSPALTFLLDDMAAAGNLVNVIVLDACRDMPLPDGSRSIGRGGLADVGRLPNLFIAYATAPGRTAADGGGANSPLATELAAALERQAADPVALLFDDVNARVYAATGGAQAPEYRNGLVRAPRWSLASAGAATGPGTPSAGPPAPGSLPRPPPVLSQDFILGTWDTQGVCAAFPRNQEFRRLADGTIGLFSMRADGAYPDRPQQTITAFDAERGIWRGGGGMVFRYGALDSDTVRRPAPGQGLRVVIGTDAQFCHWRRLR
jgi:hypothetical protein